METINTTEHYNQENERFQEEKFDKIKEYFSVEIIKALKIKREIILVRRQKQFDLQIFKT